MDVTIIDTIDKTRQLQEVVDSTQQKFSNIIAARDAEIARLNAVIANSPNAATHEQIQEVFTKMDAAMEDLIRTFFPLPPDPDA